MNKKIFLVLVVFLLMAVNVFAGSIYLSWDENTPTPTEYRIFHSSINGTYDYDSPIYVGPGVASSNGRGVTILDLQEGVVHFFTIRAYIECQNGILNSSPPSEQWVETIPCPTPQIVRPNGAAPNPI